MKRDLDLIRRILSEVESMPAGQSRDDIKVPGEYDEATVYEHVKLLIEAGLLRGKVVNVESMIVAVYIEGLTWEGHDFIDVAKDESLWTKAKESVLKPTVSFTFDLLVEWLKVQAKQTLGLP